MCGHVGYARLTGTKKARDFLVEGLWCGSWRGMDATGIAFGSTGPEGRIASYNILKKPMNGADFVSMRFVYEALYTMPDWVIGHNRAGTNGGNTTSNAHPFEEGHIVLAHNGHISNQYNLPACPPAGDWRIDSARIAFSMAHAGELETLNKLRGNLALVWMNMQTNRLNFARNDTKPLYFAFGKDGRAIYWASEDTMLQWLLDRNEIEAKDIVYPKAYKWYQFKLNDLENYDVVPFEEPKAVPAPKSSRAKAAVEEFAETKQIKPLGQKKMQKLLDNHGLRIGDRIFVSLAHSRVEGVETIATYDLCEKRLKKFKGAIQQNRSLIELRKQQSLASEDKLEIGILTGITGQNGKLMLIISDKMDTDLNWSEAEEVIRTLPEAEADPTAPFEFTSPTGRHTVRPDLHLVPTFGEVPNMPNMVYGPGGRLISKQRFLELTAEGCAKCGCALTWKRPVIWDEITTGTYIVLCENDAAWKGKQTA